MMNFSDIKKIALPFSPFLNANAFLPRRLRKLLFTLISIPLFFAVLYLLILGIFHLIKSNDFNLFGFNFPEIAQTNLLIIYGNIVSYSSLILGFFFILLAFWLALLAIESFYMFYTGLDLEEEENGRTPLISFEGAGFVLVSSETSLISDMYSFPIIKMTARRFEIEKDLKEYLKNRQTNEAGFVLEKKAGETIYLGDIVYAITKKDADFVSFLASHEITAEDWRDAILWIEHISKKIRQRERWWWKSRLGKIPGIGKDWSYGEANLLRRYAVSVKSHSAYNSPGSSPLLRQNETEELEKVLSRSSGANALIVAETDEDALEVVACLGKLIDSGKAMPSIEHKEVLILDPISLFSQFKEKSDLEIGLNKIMAEAISAGNIILVMPDLPDFISSAEKIGANLKEIVDRFLTSPDIQFITTSTLGLFHSKIESDQEIMNRFEKVSINEPEERVVLNIVEGEVLKIESGKGVFFSYPALKAVVDSARRYFPDSSAVDKSIDLLLELTPSGVKNAGKIIRKKDVADLVKLKTGVPVGGLEKEERQKLVNLEELLAERIVGQKEAIKAVATAMKRARAGVGNPNKPMGSFLFLGPTGVGKTETTKALASLFFGGEDVMHRLDMSEYNTDDSLEKLIGVFGSDKPGVLSSMLRDKPYGVLLLDEFEKTAQKVMDLFLQVLDEGFFSDMSGKRVSAKNLIIIATSNAGSDLIWKMVQERGIEGVNKEEVINVIVNEKIFRPEFLNRFDGVVVFHPLAEEHLRIIAGLMLKKLAKRLEGRGIKLVINDILIEALVKKGSDPKFGARPMQRAIQDTVESIVADKIIRQEIAPGAVLEFSAEEARMIETG